MAENLRNVNPDDLTPEGKMELQFRVLGNEMIGIKMVVDDMKMKWVAIGLVGILIMTWAAAEFGEVIMGAGGSEEVYIMEDIDG
jgi:hypothetical protein